MSLFFWTFDQYKCKTYLRSSVQRIKLSVSKKQSSLELAKRDIAKLLQEGKVEKAQIRVERIIREDFNIEALEIIELMCELLIQRLNFLANCEVCPEDLYEPVSTIVWATNRLEINELQEVKDQIKKKFGSGFIEDAMEDKKRASGKGSVDPRVKHKLSIEPPSKLIVNGYLEEIAKAYGVDYEPTNNYQDIFSPQSGPTGYSIPFAPGSGYTQAYMNDQASTLPMPTQMLNQTLTQQLGTNLSIPSVDMNQAPHQLPNLDQFK